MSDLNLMRHDDRLEMFNLTETFYWRDIDRYNYTSHRGPEYSLYTGLSLAQYSQVQ